MKIDKTEKVLANLHVEKEYSIDIISLKQALNHGLKLKKVHRVIKFNQEAWLKPYIDMNTERKKNAKNDFENDFCKLVQNAVFWKTIENVTKHKDIKLVTVEARRNYLVSEPKYHNLLAIEMKRTWILISKTVYLGPSILEANKIIKHEFCHDYVKPKYGQEAELCYMDTDSFIVHIKTWNIYADIAKDVETIFDTSNYELERPLLKGKNKNIIGLMKDDLGGKLITELGALRPKIYIYLIDDSDKNKKIKMQKKCVIKRKTEFEEYKHCLEAMNLKMK